MKVEEEIRFKGTEEKIEPIEQKFHQIISHIEITKLKSAIS